MFLTFDHFSGELEHVIQHRFGEFAGKGVLLAGVVGTDQGDAVTQVDTHRMTEFRLWAGVHQAEFLSRP